MKWETKCLHLMQQCVLAHGVSISCVCPFVGTMAARVHKDMSLCPHKNTSGVGHSGPDLCLLLHTCMCMFKLCVYMCVPGMAHTCKCAWAMCMHHSPSPNPGSGDGLVTLATRQNWLSWDSFGSNHGAQRE